MTFPLKSFSNRRGTVSVTFDGNSYNVKITTYGNLRTGAPKMSREYLDLDSVIAGEYFAASVAELKGKTIIPPKTYCAKCGRACNEYNCPPKVGGAEYWKIFQASCVHRKSR